MRGRERVEEFLTGKGIVYRMFEFDTSTHDAASAAEALGVDVGQIAKTIVFQVDGNPLVVITSGDRRVNFKKLKKALGAKKVRFAQPEEVEDGTGFVVGAVSPFGLPGGVKVLVDGSVERFEKIYPAGGETNVMCEVKVADMLAVIGADAADVCEEI